MTPAFNATTAPDDQKAVDAAYLAQRVIGYASNLPFAVGASLTVALLFAWLLRTTLAPQALGIWLAAVLASQLLRTGIGLWHRRSLPGQVSDATWLRRYRLTVLSHGLVWAGVSLLPIPGDNTLAEALRVIVIVGMVGGSFALLAFDLPAALCFGVPALGALCAHLWLLPQPVYTTLAWAGLGTLLFLSMAAHRASRVVHQYVGLQLVASRQAEALRQSEARLAEESAALQLTLDSISQGIANIDPDGRMRVFSQRARELMDMPESLVPPGATYAQLRALQEARGDLPPGGYIDGNGQIQPLRDGRHGAPPVYVRRTRSGSLIEVRTRQLPAGGLVRTYTDVTDYVKTQQALTAAKEEAERANRAKSRFLSGMSHDLRTPLNAILGFAQVLLADRHPALHPAHQAATTEIVNGAQHLLQLINDLLDLAVVESGQLTLKPAPVAVAPLLHGGLTLMQPLADGAHIRLPTTEGGITWHACGDSATVVADPTRLMQVLLNLLSNAIKYNRPGGAVRVACARAAAPASEAGPDHLRIIISDDGPGLDASQCEKLFEPFERLGASRSAVEGAGLGLALSRRLVQAMGGEIGVHSGPGTGSSFWVDLPRGPELPPAAADAAPWQPAGQAGLPAPAAPPARAGQAAPAGRSVLYIEDNPVNALLMESMLAVLGGPPLVVASRADEGLRQARALRPALILLDIELPDLNGFEVLRRLRLDPACSAIPVVAVSANAMPDDIAQGLAAGFVAYLTKPLVLPQLASVIADTLGVPGRAG